MYVPWLLLIIIVVYVIVKRADLVARVAHIRFARGNTQKSLKTFKLANKIGKMNFENKISYGYLLLRMGNIDEAGKVLNLVTMQAPAKNPTVKFRARAMLALVAWKRGELDDAIESLETVFENYKNTIVYQSLGLMYIEKGDKNRALEFNLAAYEYSDSDKIIVDNLAEAYVLCGDLEAAREMYEKLFTLEPHFPEAFFGYGKLLIELGEREKGIELARQALDKPFTFLSAITRDEVERYLETNE